MRKKLIEYVEAKGYSQVILFMDNQNYLWFNARTPEGFHCEIRVDKHDGFVWDRTARFWDMLGKVEI